MTYCEAMAMYCDNDDYKGVRMYCKKTCNSCNEDFSKYVDGTAPEADDGDGTSPTDGISKITNRQILYYSIFYMTIVVYSFNLNSRLY